MDPDPDPQHWFPVSRPNLLASDVQQQPEPILRGRGDGHPAGVRSLPAQGAGPAQHTRHCSLHHAGLPSGLSVLIK